MTRSQFSAAIVIAAAGLLLLPGLASATPLNGVLQESNCLGGGVTVTLTSITWLGGTGCTTTSTGAGIDSAAGTDITSNVGTLLAGVVGTITDLTAPTTFPVTDFITFSGTADGLTSGGAIDFNLAGFSTPSTSSINCAAAVSNGQSCIAVAGSPFLLTSDGAGDTNVTLELFGTVTDGTLTTAFTGSLETTVPDETPAQVQAIEQANGSITTGQTGSLRLVTTPEPASFIMLGSGMIALSLIRKKFKAPRA